MTTSRAWIGLLAGLLLVAGAASAHEIRPGLLDVMVRGGGGYGVT